MDSVLNQSFKDFEFLIYDDGSDGECRQVIEEIGRQDSRIRILRGEQNRGNAFGLNQCILEAKGQYLARMDGDDLCLPRRLEVQAAFLDRNPQFDYVGSAAGLLEGETLWGIRKMVPIPRKENFLPFSPFIHPSVMFRKDIFEKYGFYNTSELCRRCEDYELFIRLYREGSYGCNLEEILLYYREEKDSYKKRTLESFRREAKLRRQIFPSLGLTGIRTEWYKYKPYGTAVLPKGIYRQLKRRIMASQAMTSEEQEEGFSCFCNTSRNFSAGFEKT